MKCDLCGQLDPNLTYLSLYVIGNEGINICLSCRITLTKVAEGIKTASNNARKQGFLRGRKNIHEGELQ